MVPMRGMKLGPEFVFAFKFGFAAHADPPWPTPQYRLFRTALGKIKMPNTIFVACVRQRAVKRAMGQQPVLFAVASQYCWISPPAKTPRSNLDCAQTKMNKDATAHRKLRPDSCFPAMCRPRVRLFHKL